MLLRNWGLDVLFTILKDLKERERKRKKSKCELSFFLETMVEKLQATFFALICFRLLHAIFLLL